MPARSNRRKQTPYKDQRDLKHPRRMSTLRHYAKRRAEYANMQTLVFLIFFTYYHETLWHLWREEVRARKRPGNAKRQRKHRALVRLNIRIAKLQTKRTALRAEIDKLEERIRLKEFHLRTKATAQSGWTNGWNDAQMETAKSNEDLKAVSFSRRYREAYCKAVAEHARVANLMSKQQAKVVVQTAPVKL